MVLSRTALEHLEEDEAGSLDEDEDEAGSPCSGRCSLRVIWFTIFNALFVVGGLIGTVSKLRFVSCGAFGSTVFLSSSSWIPPMCD